MRISLCFRHVDQVYRLVWINESSQGIYMGVLGGQEEFHLSYHQDGQRHTTIGAERIQPWKDVPISDLLGIRQLHHLSLSVTENWFSKVNIYAGDEKTETVVLLDEGVFKNTRRCGLNLWLIDRPSEARLFSLVGKRAAPDENYHLITEVIVALDHFPGHKVALTLAAVGT